MLGIHNKLMSIQAHCKPRTSVFALDRRATVLNLDSLLQGQINGQEFFDENYFTAGMETLVDRAFRHLGGVNAGSSIFSLSQAMGGGKTHSMIALGLLGKDPELRRKVLGQKNPAPNLERCRIVGFNGRNTDSPGGIWGAIADQLGKKESFSQYYSPILNAPGPEAWKQLLKGAPTLLFLDELPPYLEYAVAVPVGNANLGTVTTAALANLFVAVSQLDNVCLVLSDLAGSNYSLGQSSLSEAFNRAVQGVASESRRIAVPITPVNPNGDELYHILKKRLFEYVAADAEVVSVAGAYRDALREAHGMNLTTTSPESLYARIVDSYPFHPDLRELVGKFKENEGFQQTRGVIRLMQMVVASLWKSKRCEHIDLIHPYDFDLNVDEIASEIRVINSSLSEAIAHDIAHGGDAEVEQIDVANGNSDASDAARLILIASLATTPGAIAGLREYQLIDCLQRPGRDLSKFKTTVLDKLATRAWYLHNSSDGRLYFKNQQNLAAKLRDVAQSLHVETVERMLRDHLQERFSVTLKDCYQVVKVLPLLDAVALEQEKTTLVVVRPGGQANGLPISSDWQAWWQQQQFKNRVIFLSGSRDTYQKVLDTARQSRALKDIEEELKVNQTAADDPQWRALDALADRINLQFSSALKEAFDQIVYPSIQSSLRSTGVDLAFAGNQGGEAIIRKTLENVQKFTTKTDDDSFRARAEGRLFGAEDSKVVLWTDLKRAAAVNTSWPFHRVQALEELKADAVRKGIWREEGGHVRRGPFPPPEPQVEIRELSVEESGHGSTYLRIEALHAQLLSYETGNSDPSRASSPVPMPARFEAKAIRYRFLAFDPADPSRQSPVKEWTARIRIRHQIHNRGTFLEAEFVALPKVAGIVIKYTTDGTSAAGASAATYDAPFKVPANCRVISAVAIFPEFGIISEQVNVQVSAGARDVRQIDVSIPAKWTSQIKIDDSGLVWEFISRLEKINGVRAYDIKLTAISADELQCLEYQGSVSTGYDAALLRNLSESMQTMVAGGSLRLTVNSLGFPTGQALLDWLRESGLAYSVDKVSQSR